MATIYLDNLLKPTKEETAIENKISNSPSTNHIYADLHMDLQLARSLNNDLNSIPNNDVRADYDGAAVKNSIHNIFTTSPGDKILSPFFGCSLEQHLFEPLTEFRAKIIGDTIYDNIIRYEPRVDISNVNVAINLADQSYEIIVNYKLKSSSIYDKISLLLQTINSQPIIS
jgi:phage baseplate assembly protein W